MEVMNQRRPTGFRDIGIREIIGHGFKIRTRIQPIESPCSNVILCSCQAIMQSFGTSLCKPLPVEQRAICHHANLGFNRGLAIPRTV
ncbi:MAG: hypothetical protein CMN67_02460 [Sphingomonadaceae bacterium]|nr:hypothetical protein [Sphingomonadaceae bacterium]